MSDLSNLIAEPFDPCCSGCGLEWAADDLDDGFCPDCAKPSEDKIPQDSAFYTFQSGHEVVFQDSENPFFVVRNGEMRIHATKDGSEVVIRYTDQLRNFGIETDEQLEEWSAKGEEVFDWVNNSWFEVWSSDDPDFYSEAMHELDEAISAAITLKELYV